jgi:hypothetical protein
VPADKLPVPKTRDEVDGPIPVRRRHSTCAASPGLGPASSQNPFPGGASPIRGSYIQGHRSRRSIQPLFLSLGHIPWALWHLL